MSYPDLYEGPIFDVGPDGPVYPVGYTGPYILLDMDGPIYAPDYDDIYLVLGPEGPVYPDGYAGPLFDATYFDPTYPADYTGPYLLVDGLGPIYPDGYDGPIEFARADDTFGPGDPGDPLDPGPVAGITISLAGVTVDELELVQRWDRNILVVEARAEDGSDAAEIWLGSAYDLEITAVTLIDSGVVLEQAELLGLIRQPQATAQDDVLETGSADGAPVTINGLAGNDVLTSLGANATFEYARGDGHDLITAPAAYGGQSGTVISLSGIDPDAVSLVLQDTSVLVRIDESTAGAGDGGTIRFFNGYVLDDGSAGLRLTSINFAGGTVWDTGDLTARLLPDVATDSNDLVENPVTANTYELGLGDDVIITSGFADVYVYNNGDGHDVIAEGGSDGIDGDSLRLPDLTAQNIRFTRDADDLLIVIDENATTGAVAGSLRLVDAFLSTSSDSTLIERIIFSDDSILTIETVMQGLVDATATSADDVIMGTPFDDTISGGTGDDVLAGGAGNDLYRWQHGDGDDRVLEQYSTGSVLDRLELVGVSAAQVSIGQNTEGMLIRITESAPGAGDGGDITIEGMFTGPETPYRGTSTGTGIETLQIGVDTVLDLGGIRSRLLQAQATILDDMLVGSQGDDTFGGGIGDDVLVGDRGSDTYLYTRGDGNDLIYDAVNNSGSDTLRLIGIAPEDVTLKPGYGGDLEIVIAPSTLGAGDGGRLTVTGGFSANGAYGVERIVFDDDTIWLRTDFPTMAAAAGASATVGDDRLVGSELADTLAGLEGDDLLLGNGGADLYRYARGDGSDVINDADGVGNIIEISGYTASEVTFARRGIDGPDLIIRLAGAGDEIVVINALKVGATALATLTLTDGGDLFTMAEIVRDIVAAQATEGDDIVVGTAGSDTLSGGLGTDLISGEGGSDTYLFTKGDGDDRIVDTGSDTDDVLRLEGLNVTDLAYALRAGANSDDLVLVFTGDRDRIILENALATSDGTVYNNPPTRGVDSILFADGTVWNRTDMRAQALEHAQTSRSESVLGFGGSDSFSGSAGADTLEGGLGSDTYVMARGHGHDRIIEIAHADPFVDNVEFPDFVSTEVSVTRLFKGSDSIRLNFASSPDDSLIIVDALAGNRAGIERLVFSDGVVWTAATLAELLLNNAPVATDDGYFSVTTGQSITLSAQALLRNDFDADGDALSIIAVEGGDAGFAELDANGNVVFTPTDGFFGPTRLIYTLSDGRNGLATGSVDMRVRPVAEALDDTGFFVAEDDFLTIRTERLLSNDVDGDRMIVAQVKDAVNGTVSLSSAGDVIFTPDENYNGPAGFTYVANTPDGGVDEARVTLTVTPVNDAPSARNDGEYETPEDQPFLIAASVLLQNDYDVDGDTLRLVSVTGSENLSVTLTDDGFVQVTPAAYYFGTSSFSYTVADPDGLLSAGTVTIKVLPVNNAPLTTEDIYTQREDMPLVISVADLLANDFDPDGDPMTIVQVSSSSFVGNGFGGAAELLENGTILFTPNQNFDGTAFFSYVVDDGQGAVSSGRVTIQMEPVNDNPIAQDDRYYPTIFTAGNERLIGTEDTPLEISLVDLMRNDFDVEGLALKFENVSEAANGTIEITDHGTLIFNPDQDFWGEATFNYLVSDPEGAVDDAIVTLFFENVDDAPPVAGDDVVEVYEDVVTIIPQALLLGNDTDIDRDVLTITGARYPGLSEILIPEFKGSLVRNEDGDFVYTPLLNNTKESGFFYTVTDGILGSDEGFVDIRIIAINDQPTAVADTVASTKLGVPLVVRISDIMANDFDVDDDPLTGIRSISFVGIDSTSVGVATVRDGFIVLRVPEGYSGPVEMTYRITDTDNVQDTAKITALVTDSHDLVIQGTSKVDLLIGSAQGEAIFGLASDDIIEAEAGDDLIDGGDGGDEIDGGDGFDTVTFDGSTIGVRADLGSRIGQGGFAQGDVYTNVEALIGTVWNDTLGGDEGANLFEGREGRDLIEGRGGVDTLLGGLGDDSLVGGAQGDLLDGGDGTDAADYRGSAQAVTVSLADGTALGGDAQGDTLVSIENLNGSDFDDQLTGNDDGNRLDGGRGADTLLGGLGDDTLSGGRGADVLRGGDGVDIADYTFSLDGVQVDMADGASGGGDAEGDTFEDIEIVQGSYHGDTILGSHADNILRGGRGADVLDGRGGFDTADFSTADEGVGVDLSTGMGTAGEALGDTYAGIEAVRGSVWADTITGSAGAETFDGNWGDDTVAGAAGSDAYIFGYDSGNDLVIEAGLASDIDRVKLTAEIAPKDISVIRDGDDLLLELERGDGFLIDTLRVTDHFVSAELGIEEVVFADGTIWDRDQIDALQRLGRFNALDDVYRLAVEDIEALIDPADLIANDAEDVTGINVIAVENAVNGTVRLTDDGQIAFIGDQDYNGDAFFDYVLRDQFGRESSARVEVNIAPVNDRPVGVDDGVFAGTEDTVLRISYAQLVGNDIDVDGDSLTLLGVTPIYGDDGEFLYQILPTNSDFPYTNDATKGIIWLDGTNVNFRPAADHFGFAGFEYTLADPDGLTSTAEVELYFIPVNDAPRSGVRNTDQFEIRFGLTTDISLSSLLANDYDVEGDAFDIDGIHSAFGGAMVFDPDTGLVSFTPDAVGDAGFSYDLEDIYGARSTILVDLNVIPLNDAPIARDDGPYVTDEDTILYLDPAQLLANDTDNTDPLDEVLFISGLDRFAENGRVELLADGRIAFTPRADYNGAAGFKYQVADGNGGFDIGYVSVTVLPTNDGPVLRDDIALGFEDQPITIIPGEVFGNDLDPEGDVIFYDGLEILGVIDGDYTSRDPVEISYGFDMARLDAGVVATATLADGSDLPDGLLFDAQTLTLSGALPAGQVAMLNVLVTLTNPQDGSVHQEQVALALEDDLAAGVTVVPQVALFELGAGDWSLRPAGNQPLPNWLEFNAETLTLTKVGDAPEGETDALRLQLRFEPEPEQLPDGTFAFGRAGFTIEVLIDPQADIPDAINALFANDDFFAGQGLYALPISAGASVQAQSENGAPLADWLNFDAGDLSFAGTPPPVFVGTPPVRLNVSEGDLAYSVLTELPVDATYSLLSDLEGFSVNLGSDRFNLVTPEDFFGQVVLSYTAKDEKDGISLQPAEIVVNVLDTPEAPEAADDVFQTLEDTPITIALADLLANDFDAEGDAIRMIALRHGGAIEVSRGGLRLIDAVGDGTDAVADTGAAETGADAGTGQANWAYTSVTAGAQSGFGFATSQAYSTHDENIFCPCCDCADHGIDPENAANGSFAPIPGLAGFGTLETMTDFVTTGFWGTSPRFHNVTDIGRDPNDGVILYNVTGWENDADGITEERAELVREAFKLFEATLGIQFRETTDTDQSVTDIFFGDNGEGANAASTLLGGGEIGYSRVNIAADWSGGTSTYGDYTLQTILHEIGHTLGLGHQGRYNLTADYGTENQFDNDSWQATMMSYFSQSANYNILSDFALLQTPMAVDWLALEDIYNPQGYGTFNAFTEDTVWGFNTSVTSEVSDIWANWSDWADVTASTLVDGGGLDTLDLSGYANNSLISLAPSLSASTAPSFSNIGGWFGNLTIAAGTIIENAIGGAGDEVFYGNSADNVLMGNGGQDTFIDSDGNDTYIGGLGTDLVVFTKSIGDYAFNLFEGALQVIDDAIDLVESSVDFLSFLDRTLSWQSLVSEFLPDSGFVAPREAAEAQGAQIGVTADGLPTLEGGVYLLAMTDGSDLPFWLSIDRDTGVIKGDVPFNLAIDLSLDVTVTDGAQSYIQTIAVAADGNADAYLTFTPEPGWNGTYSFRYVITDDAQGTAEGVVAIEVIAVNDPPEAVTDRVTAYEDQVLVLTPQDLLANDIDIDGDTLTLLTVGNAENGTVVFENGEIRFTPTPNFDGAASFTYVVTDGTDGASQGRVEVNVISTNQRPVAGADRFTGFEDEPIIFTLADLLANDSDPDGDDFGFVRFNGSIEGGSIFALPGGRFQFVPDQNLFGEFTTSYTINDGRLSTTGTVIFDLAAVNDGPLLNADPTILAREDEVITVVMADLLANDVDIEGDSFAVTSVFDPENGAVTLVDGIATFTPRSDYFGNAGFFYLVEDAGGAVSQGFVNITLNPENDKPFAITDTQFTTLEDTPLEIDPALLLANDIDPDGDTLTVLSVYETLVDFFSGAVTEIPLALLENGNYLFTPYQNDFGDRSFSYRISDGKGGTATTSFTIDVIPVDDAPMPRDDDYTGTEDVAQTLLISDLLSNDVDPDQSGLIFTGFSNENGLTVTNDGAGRLLITPDAERYGPARFDYTVQNASGLTATAQVEIMLAAVNDAPVIPVIELVGVEDEVFTAALDPTTFNDAEGDAITISVRAPDGGTLPGWLMFDPLTLTFTGEPPANFNGTIMLEVVAFDGTAETVRSVPLTFASVNDAPVIAAITLTGTEDAVLTAVLDSGAFSDSDGDTLTISLRSAGGAALPAWLGFDAETLTLTGQPPADFSGTVMIEAVAFDGTVETIRAVPLVIAPVNDAPVAVGESYDAGQTLVFTVLAADLLANDTDLDSTGLTIVAVTGVPGVQAILTPEGDIAISRERDLEGPFSITYTVSDGVLTDQATLVVELEAANLAPDIAAFGPLDADEDSTIDLVIPDGAITDPEGDALVISVTRAGGTALPAWLTFDAATQRLSGTAPLNFNGTLALEVTAGDGSLQTTRGFDLVINPVNDMPTLGAPLSDRSAIEDTPFSIQLQQRIYSDVDGDTLGFALVQADGSALPDWISFDATTLTLSGQAPQDLFGNVGLRLQISDGQATISDDFNLAITGTPDAPVLVAALPDVATDDSGAALGTGAAFVITAPTGNFSDPDQVPLSFAARLADGSALPAWLVFDGQTFSGTAPRSAAASPVQIELLASDGTTTVSDVFELSFEMRNDAPVAVDDAFDVTVPNTLSIDAGVLLANDGDPDGDALAVTAVGAAQHGTTTFENGAVLYKADFGYKGSDQFTYTISDGVDTAEATVTVTVDNPFDQVQEGGTGTDFLFGGRGDDLVMGGAGRDYLFSSGGNDYLDGGAGSDVLSGGRGNDTLRGGAGDDLIFAGGGDDVISGGQGNDRMFGGSGQDRFDFASGDGSDVIYGFQTPRGGRRFSMPGDELRLSIDGIDSFADLMAHASQTRGGVLLDLGDDDQIFLAGTRLAALDEDQFTFY